MGWASRHIEKLQEGITVSFRPGGNSMQPKVCDGDLVTIEPLDDHKLKAGDVVLCKVRGREYLHLIKAARPDGRFLIGNNRGGINGWIKRKAIYGRCTSVIH